MQTSNTSTIHTAHRSLAVEWERHWCSVVGVLTLIFFCFYAKSLFEIAERCNWRIENLYHAVFELATFIAGFLFAIFAYVKTTENRILDAIRQSVYFSRASKYMIIAMTAAAILSILTLPLYVTVPEIKERDFTYWLFCGWAALTIYATSLSVRSMYHFVTILNHSSPKKGTKASH